MNQVPVPPASRTRHPKYGCPAFEVFDLYKSYRRLKPIPAPVKLQEVDYPKGSGGKVSIVKSLNGRSYILREFHHG